MPAAKYNINIEQGATYRESFSWKSGGAVVDLTGYTGRMQIRASIPATAILATLTTENGGIVTGADGFSLFLSATQTTAFAFANGVYDVELLAPGGDVDRVLQGKVKVSPEVTR